MSMPPWTTLDHGMEIEPGQFDGIRAGKRAWVIGTGPSVRKITPDQWKAIDQDITIGCSNIAAFHDVRYLVISDIEPEYQHTSVQKSKAEYKFAPEGPQITLPYPHVRYHHTPRPGRTFAEGLLLCWSSAHAALNLAIVMGCDPIILLGIDYSGKDDHVVPQTAWSLPQDNWNTSCDNFKLFKPIAEDLGVTIINANLDSNMLAFTKTPLREILSG